MQWGEFMKFVVHFGKLGGTPEYSTGELEISDAFRISKTGTVSKISTEFGGKPFILDLQEGKATYDGNVLHEQKDASERRLVLSNLIYKRMESLKTGSETETARIAFPILGFQQNNGEKNYKIIFLFDCYTNEIVVFCNKEIILFDGKNGNQVLNSYYEFSNAYGGLEKWTRQRQQD